MPKTGRHPKIQEALGIFGLVRCLVKPLVSLFRHTRCQQDPIMAPTWIFCERGRPAFECQRMEGFSGGSSNHRPEVAGPVSKVRRPAPVSGLVTHLSGPFALGAASREQNHRSRCRPREHNDSRKRNGNRHNDGDSCPAWVIVTRGSPLQAPPSRSSRYCPKEIHIDRAALGRPNGSLPRALWLGVSEAVSRNLAYPSTGIV
jgi:hypothetical protein